MSNNSIFSNSFILSILEEIEFENIEHTPGEEVSTFLIQISSGPEGSKTRMIIKVSSFIPKEKDTLARIVVEATPLLEYRKNGNSFSKDKNIDHIYIDMIYKTKFLSMQESSVNCINRGKNVELFEKTVQHINDLFDDLNNEFVKGISLY